MANSSSSSAGTNEAGPSRPRLFAVRRGGSGPANQTGEARDLSRLWLTLSIVGVVAGGVLWFAGQRDAANIAWGATTAIELIPLAKTVVLGLVHRQPGVDVIALLAMAGALALAQYLAGAVIALMLSSGKALESYANRRATKELSGLLARAPRTVTRYEDGELRVRPIDEVRQGDHLLVKSGEVLPVDGLTLDAGVLDESALSGESRPVERPSGDRVRSGAVNAGPALRLVATATAQESTYAGIVRLVTEAQETKAPAVRVADRYATIFIPVTLVIAGVAWALSGDPIRALSVLVVATPCPLILAVPIAIVAGISRAARRGIIVKNGGALETIARARVLLFDKTGTLTAGIPTVGSVEVFGAVTADELLRLAASLDQVSPHVLASAIVRSARERDLPLGFPDDVAERYGAGIQGTVAGRHVALGKAAFVAGGGPLPAGAREVRRRSMLDGSSCVFVALDGEVVGAIMIDDPIRPDSPRTIRSLRRAGIGRVVMVTGDHPDVAESVGAALGVDRILSQRAPDEKVEAVEAERLEGVTIMVGDGLNDAPALAAADVGVAMGARGATASSEAADVVLVVDRLDRLVDAIVIAQRTRRIAIQSILLGMGLAFGFMFVAAFGLFGPVAGAIVQEGIDVTSILNALRALGGGREGGEASPHADVSERFRAEHRAFASELDRIRATADTLGTQPAAASRVALEAVREFLVVRLPEHEAQEAVSVYPAIAAMIGGEDPMGGLNRIHIEIAHLTRVYAAALDDLPLGGPGPEDRIELRRLLYGVYAILRLDFAQQEEAYAWLASEDPSTGS
jgi:heavy metal translocating P-type ATPase